MGFGILVLEYGQCHVNKCVVVVFDHVFRAHDRGLNPLLMHCDGVEVDKNCIVFCVLDNLRVVIQCEPFFSRRAWVIKAPGGVILEGSSDEEEARWIVGDDGFAERLRAVC